MEAMVKAIKAVTKKAGLKLDTSSIEQDLVSMAEQVESVVEISEGVYAVLDEDGNRV